MVTPKRAREENFLYRIELDELLSTGIRNSEDEEKKKKKKKKEVEGGVFILTSLDIT